jgi:hypothetical protein
VEGFLLPLLMPFLFEAEGRRGRMDAIIHILLSFFSPSRTWHP